MWQTDALKLLEPFIVRAEPDHRHDHWQGGSPFTMVRRARSAIISLFLFWNLDCSDPRFVDQEGRPVFHDLDRLALYWCVPCFASIDYVLLRTGNVRVLNVNGKPVPEVIKATRRPTFSLCKLSITISAYPHRSILTIRTSQDRS